MKKSLPYRLNSTHYAQPFFAGSNLLLHRLFVEKGIPESLQLISFDSDTNLCPAIYVSITFILLINIDS